MARILRPKIQTFEEISKINRLKRQAIKDGNAPVRPVRPPNHSSPFIGIVKGNTTGGSGRPMFYDPLRMPHMARILCSEYGFTTPQLAKVFCVSSKTVESWLIKHKDFKAAVQAGKDEFDGVKVENTLLKLALGYEYDERTSRSISLKNKNDAGETIAVPARETIITTKQALPNAKAIMFWLTNRQPERWNHIATINAKIESKTEHVDKSLKITADLSKMDVTQLKMLRDMISLQNNEESKAIEAPSVHIQELLDKAESITDAELI